MLFASELEEYGIDSGFCDISVPNTEVSDQDPEIIFVNYNSVFEEEEKPKVPNAWRIATLISFVVIIGLVTINILMGTRGLRSGDIQSLVILPFNNFTGDDRLDYVAAGMNS